MNLRSSVSWCALLCVTFCGCQRAFSNEREGSARPGVSLDSDGSPERAKPAAKHRKHAPAVAPEAAPIVDSTSDNDPWASAEACEELLRQGHKHGRDPGLARLATWNVRWFPDGAPGHASSQSKATNLQWFSCVVAWLEVDALALQELKGDFESRSKMDGVVDSLNRRTGGSWALELDTCPARLGQHVGWLINEARVKLQAKTEYGSINPQGEACAGQLRPGLGVTLAFPGGLDLHAISVHLKSGVEPRDIELRRRSWAAFPSVVSNEVAKSKDPDLLIVGDFNSMGCRTCGSPLESGSELAALDRELQTAEVPIRRLSSDFGCSHYYQRKPALLDQVLVTVGTRELEASATARVEGYCKKLQCQPFKGKEPEPYKHLSDHCPIVIELADRDLDP